MDLSYSTSNTLNIVLVFMKTFFLIKRYYKINEMNECMHNDD